MCYIVEDPAARHTMLTEAFGEVAEITRARLGTLQRIERQFGKGAVSTKLMVVAKQNAAMAESKLTEAELWGKFMGLGEVGDKLLEILLFRM